MGGIFVAFVAWVYKDEISNWISNAVAEGIRRSKEER